MIPYRLGEITVQDPEAGSLVLQGDGYAAAGEISTLLVSPAVARYLAMADEDHERAQGLVENYRQALRALGPPPGAYTPPSLDERARAARDELRSGAARLLGAERAAKLARLSWRILNGVALVDDELADRLRLTPAERRAIAEAVAQSETENQRALGSFGAARQQRLAGHQPLEDAALAAAAAADERALAILTPEQRQQFERLKRERP